MAADLHGRIEVHQCVFGYDDGHRLLASSVRLPSDAASLLLRLSDLAPGVSLNRNQGYWTGIPLLTTNSYALLRTWPAPEIKRPGCVWTHALVIGFAAMGRLVNLSYLQRLAARPSREKSFDTYTKPLLIKADASELVSWFGEPFDLSARDALRMLRAAYGILPGGTIEAAVGELDSALFALWSQQWPRLRRSFAFRTANAPGEVAAFGPLFDIRIISRFPLEPNIGRRQQSDIEPELWESYAIEDLRSSEPTEFRRFLWRYGADVRQGRSRFEFLARLYAATRSPFLTEHTFREVLSATTEALPEREDGKTLKRDLVSAGHAAYSLFPPADPLESVAFFVDDARAVSLPSLPAEVFEALWRAWPDHKNEILSLAERALTKDPMRGVLVAGEIAQMLDRTNVLPLTRDYLRLRRFMIKANPSLLDSDALAQEPTHEVLDLLRLVPNTDPVVERALERLVTIDSVDVALEMFERVPNLVFKTIIYALDRDAKGIVSKVSSAWTSLVSSHRSELLKGGFIEAAKSMRTLAILAEWLNYDSPEVLQAGPGPWAEALRRVTDDLEASQRQRFFAFLLVVALRVPTPSAETLFETAFEGVYNDLAAGNFSDQSRVLLSHHLPDLHRWQQWDMCLRLRIAVVRTYIENGLSPLSFAALSTSDQLTDELIEVASRTSRGERYVQQVQRLKF